MVYLIAYDITKNPVRNRVCKYLSGWGRRVQKSVFECDLKGEELKQITAYIQDLIDTSTDRCHFYRVCAECTAYKFVFGGDLEPAWGQAIVV